MSGTQSLVTTAARVWAFPFLCAIASAGVAVAGVRLGLGEYGPVFSAGNVGLSLALLLRQHAHSPDRMRRKSWKINLGLREGYDPEGKTHSVDEAIAVFKRWALERSRAGLPYLTGSITGDTMVYVITPEKPSALTVSSETTTEESKEEEEEAFATAEPSAIVFGELRPRYDQGRSDEEVLATLRDLARALGKALRQNRVYFTLEDVQHSVECGGGDGR